MVSQSGEERKKNEERTKREEEVFWFAIFCASTFLNVIRDITAVFSITLKFLNGLGVDRH